MWVSFTACLFRPILILYAFFTLFVIPSFPGLSAEQRKFLLFQIGQVNVYAFDFAVATMCCLLVMMLFRHMRAHDQLVSSLFRSPLTRVILLMFSWRLFIAFLSIQKGFHLQNVLRILSGETLMFMVLVTPLIPGINEKKERFFKFTLWLGLALFSFGAIRYFVTSEVELTSSGTLRSLLGNDVVVLMFPLCYLIFYRYLRVKSNFLTISTAAVLALGTTFTGHRSAYVVLLICFCALYVLGIREKVRYLWIPAFGVTALVLALFISVAFNISQRQGLAQDMIIRFGDTFNLQNKTTRERLSYWQYANNVLKITPIIGLGRFPAYNPEISHNREDPRVMVEGEGGITRAAHNFLLDTFIHEGFSGLAVLILFVLLVLKQSSDVRFRDPAYGNWLFVYIVVFFVFSLFNTSFSTAHAVLLYIAVGLVNFETIKTEGSFV